MKSIKTSHLQLDGLLGELDALRKEEKSTERDRKITKNFGEQFLFLCKISKLKLPNIGNPKPIGKAHDPQKR